MFIFTFTLLGLEWFAFKVKFNANDEVDLSENGHYPDFNFNTFLQSFLTVFTVLTSDGWHDIYFRHYVAAGRALSTIFFISLMIIG